jgi:hypothetical protein
LVGFFTCAFALETGFAVDAAGFLAGFLAGVLEAAIFVARAIYKSHPYLLVMGRFIASKLLAVSTSYLINQTG